VLPRRKDRERRGGRSLCGSDHERGQPGRTGALQGTLLGADEETPVLGISYRAGIELARLAERGRVRVRVGTRTERGEREASSVVADLHGATDEVVLLGAHLDSVAAGPGINDNGSGVAVLVEIARALAEPGARPRRTVRFPFWGAEELGLHGSRAYVAGLEEDERAAIVAAMETRHGRLAERRTLRLRRRRLRRRAGRPGRLRAIERLYVAVFRDTGLATAPAALDGSSDYRPFMDAGIPVGGVFTGADEAKTPAQARAFGGEAGRPYDPCYHRGCDRASNVDLPTLVRTANATLAVSRTLAGG
jgi:Zn-dependent M28 family amino/carboxypeptidase